MSVRACRVAALPLLAWVVVALVTGCALERAALSGGGRAGMDSGVGLDADVATTDTGTDTVDAFREPGDATREDSGPTPCPVACTDGRVCESGTCVCPAGVCCPACTDGRTCSAGSCTCPSGECCPACADGRECVSGACMTPACGGLDQPCCAGDSCTAPATVCNGGGFLEPPRACRHCGEDGEPCCPGNTCGGGSTRFCALGTCRDCGRRWQLCCPGGVCTEDSCMTGLCRP